jgi:hypothetical protein
MHGKGSTLANPSSTEAAHSGRRSSPGAGPSMGGGVAMMHHHRRQAGVDAASFYQHRARAALPAIATRL